MAGELTSASVTLTRTEEGDICIILPNEESMVFESFSTNTEGVSFVRFYDMDGEEVVGWVSDEWRDAPEEVMGGILGKLCECLKGDGDA